LLVPFQTTIIYNNLVSTTTTTTTPFRARVRVRVCDREKFE